MMKKSKMKKSLAILLAGMMMILNLTVPGALPSLSEQEMLTVSAEDGSPEVIEEAIRLINENRVSAGLPQFYTAPSILQAAQDRANELPSNYKNIDSDRATAFFAGYGIRCGYWYEVCSRFSNGTASYFVKDTLSRSYHKEWIMDREARSIGIGQTVSNNNGKVTYYWILIVTDNTNLPGSYIVGAEAQPSETTTTETTTTTPETTTTTTETTTTTPETTTTTTTESTTTTTTTSTTKKPVTTTTETTTTTTETTTTTTTTESSTTTSTTTTSTTRPTTTTSTTTTSTTRPTTTTSTTTTSTTRPTTTTSTTTTSTTRPTTTTSTTTTSTTRPTTTTSTTTTSTTATTTETTPQPTDSPDYGPTLEYDNSPMHVGEKRHVHVTDKIKGQIPIVTISESDGQDQHFSWYYDASASDLVLTALKPGENIALYVYASTCAFGDFIRLTVLEPETTTTPVTTTATATTTTTTSTTPQTTTTTATTETTTTAPQTTLAPARIEIIQMPTKTEYNLNEWFNLDGGMVFVRAWDTEANNTNGTSGKANEFTLDMYNYRLKVDTDYKGHEAGQYTITLRYQQEGNDLSTSFKVNVNDPNQARMLGDLNNDRSVDAEDATRILIVSVNLAAGVDPSTLLSEEDNLAADVNNDKSVDAVDATIILRYAAYQGAGGKDSLETFYKNGMK